MSTSTMSVASSVALQSFSRDLGASWSSLEPLCIDPVVVDDVMHTLRAATTADGVTTPLGDLEALVAGWHHFDPAQRAVVAGAVAYLADPTTSRDAATDERVVRAAVHAVLRRR